MTYKNGAEIILRKLAGGDIPDGFPITEEEVYFIMSQIAPLLIKKDFFETFNLDKSSVDPTIFTTILSKVFKSDSKNEWYAVLPNAPLMLLGSMIPSVSYEKDRFTTFQYVDAARLNNFHDLNVLTEMEGNIFTYEYVQGCDTEHRLIFFNLDDCVKQLRVRLVQNVDFENFDANANIPIKPELAFQLLDECYKWFVPQDMANEDKVMDNRNNNVT